MEDRIIEACWKYGNRFRVAEDIITLAISLAWYRWTQRKVDLPVSVWVQTGFRQAFDGRDLPGCGTGRSDALRHAVCAAGMARVADKGPGPHAQLEWRERYEAWEATLNRREEAMVKERLHGTKGQDMAFWLDISPGRITQLFKQMEDRLTL